MKHLVFLLICLLIVAGCASKRYAKKGAKFQEAGYYDKAAEMYWMSVKKNPKNVDAQIGLKVNGQMALFIYLDEFQKHYQNDDAKEAVYAYLKADEWYNKARQVGCELDFPSSHRDDYAEVKNIYLRKQYNQAVDLLEKESFAEAEAMFNEILKIDANYNDVASLRITAHYEPIYRRGLGQMQNEKYRSAYYSFNTIVTEINQYKEAFDLRNKALDNALITIAVMPFEDKVKQPQIGVYLRGSIIKSVSELKTPFIKVIDRDMSGVIKSEQLRTLEGNVDPTVSAKAGKMLGVKAFLTGSVDQYDVVVSDVKKTQVKAYLREKKYEMVNGQKVETIKYHKTTYSECTQSINMVCRFRFQLISAETGAILLTDVITENQSDEVKYATFDGNIDALVPGYWENEKTESVKDEVLDNENDVKNMKKQFSARKQLNSQSYLYNEIQNQISRQVASKINNYDPEK